MSLWLDCSGSYAIVPSPEQVADLRALGFEGAIVGTSWSRPQALAQLSAFQSGGMRTQEYQFPSALRPPQGDWWIDAELPDATMITLRNAMSAGARGPYSRKGWADENQPGWNCKAEFPDAELWDARYVHGDVRCLISEAISTGRDVAAAIATERAMMPPFRPYWGFDRAKITQWHNSITICGVNMDLNEYEEDGMDTETRAAIGAILTQLGKLGEDQRRLTEDVRGTFQFLYEHVIDKGLHGGAQDTMIMDELEKRMDALDARLAGGAAELVRAGKALGG